MAPRATSGIFSHNWQFQPHMPFMPFMPIVAECAKKLRSIAGSYHPLDDFVFYTEGVPRLLRGVIRGQKAGIRIRCCPTLWKVTEARVEH